MTIKYQALITESLAKQIAESLREAIIEGELKVDERLPTEEELAARFEVSRPTIREALKRLAAQNLIRSRRGPAGGTFVNRPSQEDLRSALTTAVVLLVSIGEFSSRAIAEARSELESLCCRLAAERRVEPNLLAMATELEIQKDVELADQEFWASGVRFHRALVDATQNPVLQFAMFIVLEALQTTTHFTTLDRHEREFIIAQHEHIYAAIEDRNPAAAASLVSEHINYLSEKYAQGLRRQQER